MVRCYNISESFIQNVSGVSFVSDNDGKTGYASFEGKKQRFEIDHESEFGAELHRIALWTLASVFGCKEAINLFLEEICPLLKGAFIRKQGWYSFDSVQNCLVRVWRIMTGINTKAKPYNPSKGSISTWLEASVRRECEDQRRYKSRIKRDSGLSAALALDGGTELSSIGDKGLFGLVFELSDPQDAPRKGKWIVGKKADPTFEQVCSRENRRFLDNLPISQRDKDILIDYFGGEKASHIAEQYGLSKVAISNIILRIVNRQRVKYGFSPIIRLGCKGHTFTTMDDCVKKAGQIVRSPLNRGYVVTRDNRTIREFASRKDADEFVQNSRMVLECFAVYNP